MVVMSKNNIHPRQGGTELSPTPLDPPCLEFPIIAALYRPSDSFQVNLTICESYPPFFFLIFNNITRGLSYSLRRSKLIAQWTS